MNLCQRSLFRMNMSKVAVSDEYVPKVAVADESVSKVAVPNECVKGSG